MAKNRAFAGVSLALSTLFALAAPKVGAATPAGGPSWAPDKEADLFDTPAGPLRITFLGHASLVFEFGGSVLYVDPVKQYGDYAKYPKADLILVSHEHGDHLDAASIAALSKPSTRILLPEASRKKLGSGEALAWGQTAQASGAEVLAVPAYNLSPGRTGYHPKGRGDLGFVLQIGKLKIYVAGDTEALPEMASLGPIDIAFLPMNLPYTMTPEQAAQAARLVKPKILYPYHFGDSDTSALVKLLADEPGIEIRLRKLQ